jgi:hypothetical protein
MNEKMAIEKAVKYLNKLLQMKPLRTTKEIKEVKETREYLDSMIYSQKKIRSKNANSYCWALCTEIGNVMRLDKEEVYLNMLKHYGQVMMIPVEKGKPIYGYFKYYEYETTSILNGKEADWYKVYKGSSQFDNREMSILLEGIIQEANQLGIPTITDEELKKIKGSWHGE